MTHAPTPDKLIGALPDMEAIRQSLITKVQGKRRHEASLPQKKRDALLQEITSAAKDGDPLMLISQPYPPCLKRDDDLTPITLAELHLETHHSGRMLRAKRVGPSASRHASAQYMVEDATGMELLVLDFLAFPDDLFLPPDAQITIKEPYLRIGHDSTAHLAVAHPRDIEAVYLTQSNTESTVLKDRGNLDFKAARYASAFHAYTEALAAPNIRATLKANIHRNRALTNFKLGRFDDAILDARHALELEPECDHVKRGKTLLCKGLAEYALGHLGAADTLERATEANSTKEATDARMRAVARCSEAETGQFDFYALANKLSAEKPYVEAASFVQRISVRQTPNRGRGLFAQEDIAFGHLVLVEKSFCSVFSNQDAGFDATRYEPARFAPYQMERAAFFKAVLLKMYHNPSLRAQVSDLHADSPKPPSPDTLDYFHIERLTALNSLGCRVPKQVNAHIAKPYPFGRSYAGDAVGSSGLWIKTSYINHSCIPNAEPSVIGDLMVVKATRNITQGEEITISYFNDIDYQTRSRKIKSSWGFDCTCELCTAEAATSPADMEERIQLRDLITEQQMSDSSLAGSLEAADSDVDDVEATYDEQLYADLPREDLAHANVRLYLMHLRQRNVANAARALKMALEAQNIKLVIRNQEVRLLDSRRQINSLTVECLLGLANFYERALNEPANASQLRELAKTFYFVLNATTHGFNRIIPS
ncbi:uncharacterized protein MYCFIDRAFT_77623 [Pseudocercospora fijiensis CIRAD86]|uniref:SET domain-containing protein n=1 Tax=Pseudocercospora fijiensis (strain CIRAD86) TaxID=383855 RepID=M3AY42_PSEFD|nr:uncharacterized protein MYCFIDRAFT_77623 [Pseudocercospora fijiensis CIRAD86]EME82078.1 hypothetical protein MYCFIDRAFT_77623 [Pseudocercospora fijiensis CIRAD86]